ncbi:MAG: alpha/beta hydrolase [Flavobacteriaceae bacterium]|jgi:pimeloyl-ACP methyl ester carboxylesterase|nr:alpha/beta hydrolase [Flavobacteriaceae bacterium]
MPLIPINNKKVFVLELNPEASEAIVLIHGMFTNMSIFYFNIAPKLAEKYHVVLYDLRSHGMSEKVDHGYSLKALSQDLLDLMDVLNLSKVDLVGYSFGGLISLYTAIHFPEKIKKIAIIDTPTTNKDGDIENILEKYADVYLGNYVGDYTASTNIIPNNKQLQKSKKLFDYLLYTSSLPQDSVLDKNFSSKENMNLVKHETLLLYGNKSDCLPDGEFLNAHIPNSILQVGEGDHNIPIQNFEWIIEKLHTFFII